MAWIVEEEKEFITVGTTSTGKRFKTKIGHWPTTCKDTMEKVLENMRAALPESTFTVTEVN